ncbi:hypothetical protein NKW84_08145 [Acetobacter senegalensis]|uniref:hypothetical protein n=1 Tax=Acetobacter senegalensis TaxID=446692 RepID=UPI00209D96A9|nr:hypothetical protein [Acetobacter senegalensis]MCP1195828.1 hypothetical protein [Acetobacter senegalensis]
MAFASATSEWLIGSPVLAVIARYAPASLNTLMVGTYSLTVGAGMYWGSEISDFASPVVKTAPYRAIILRHCSACWVWLLSGW